MPTSDLKLMPKRFRMATSSSTWAGAVGTGERGGNSSTGINTFENGAPQMQEQGAKAGPPKKTPPCAASGQRVWGGGYRRALPHTQSNAIHLFFFVFNFYLELCGSADVNALEGKGPGHLPPCAASGQIWSK